MQIFHLKKQLGLQICLEKGLNNSNNLKAFKKTILEREMTFIFQNELYLRN